MWCKQVCWIKLFSVIWHWEHGFRRDGWEVGETESRKESCNVTLTLSHRKCYFFWKSLWNEKAHTFCCYYVQRYTKEPLKLILCINLPASLWHMGLPPFFSFPVPFTIALSKYVPSDSGSWYGERVLCDWRLCNYIWSWGHSGNLWRDLCTKELTSPANSLWRTGNISS